MALVYKDTVALHKILKMQKRLRIIQGGSSAGKTIAILLTLIDKAQSVKGEIISVVSETLPHLKKGSIRDFLNIMNAHGYYNDKNWNRTDYIYTFETGTKIEFFSADNSDKVRGPRRNDLFINECNNIGYNTYIQLAIRTSGNIYLDYNPVSEFWVHEHLINKSNDCEFIIVNYKDNDALPESIVREIESHKDDKNFWSIYGLGELGDTEGKIYSGWEFLDDVPEDAKLKVKGLDFGYTNDPTALVDVYEYNGGYIFDEVLYEKGLTNDQIAKIIGKDTVITIADSSEPKSIAEIAQYGVKIIGAKKGKGSVSHRIDTMRSKKISITKRSLNGIKEYRNYIWVTDRDGKIINEPRDLFNHYMDAASYAISFLHPTIKQEEYVQPKYEAPAGIPSAPTPILTIGTKTREQFLNDLKRAQGDDDYETTVPWEPAGY